MWFVKIFVCVLVLFRLLLQGSIFRWLADSRSRFIFEQNLFLLSLAWFLNQALLSSSSCLGCRHTLQNEKDTKFTWSREREAKCRQGNKFSNWHGSSCMLKVEQWEEDSSIENTYEQNTKPTPQKKEKNKATARDWRNLTEKREQDLQKKDRNKSVWIL